VASQLGNPLSQSDEQLAFLAAYGWAMWAVQVFEYRLAGLSIMRTPAKSPARVLDTPQKVYSALQKQFAQSEHRFERASAKELRNLLATDLPEPLNSELDELVDKRNDLAHRYLRRTLHAGASLDLRQELQSVKALGERFADAGDKLLVLMEEAAANRPPNLSDTQFAALQRLGSASAEGVPLDEALRRGVLDAE
jgi:ADP-heptose:LPS heptosyltransferase